ncbi:MAG: 5'/3'-nucleotidase SurE [Microthrixaceae bacterium]
MRVLVTNDDGLHAPGLAHLANAAVAAGHEVIAVAPEENRSGAAAAIGDLGEHSSIRCRRMELAGAPAVEAYALDGPPALCVIVALLGAFGDRPEVVFSGINPGLNTGRSATHSGTVGAVITAANFGVSGVAVSTEGHEPQVKHWTDVAEVGAGVLDWVCARESVTTVNVSVPDLPAGELGEPRFGTLGPMGSVHTEIDHRDDEWLHLGFKRTAAELPEGTDTRLIADRHIVVTPIVGLRAVELGGDEMAGLLRGAEPGGGGGR